MCGGVPGMDGARGSRGKPPVDRTKFYKLLEVSTEASNADIRKAYKKLALKHHPDKGGDKETFREITRAYEVLSDSEKRAKYDRGGEEAVEGGSEDASDIIAQMFGVGGGRQQRRRQKTKDVVQPLKVTLEQLYNGAQKKMAIHRQVIDKNRGVRECQECGGRGVTVQVIRMGPMIQQMQAACRACGGQGKSFQTSKEREVVEVLIQKGSPDNHKVVFREMADEHPDADAGDVIFQLKQEEHADFKRKGADLFIKRKISLVEALCGFTMELTHLDGRKLLIKSAAGEIVKPMSQGFDPLADEETKAEWETLEGFDCPDIENTAQGDTTDVDVLKEACETQLKRQGVDVGCFVVDARRAYFKQCTREEALAAKKPAKGKTMYVLADPDTNKSFRMLKALKGEGMPTFRNPFVHGNLFLILTIEFPDSLPAENQIAIRNLLPAPLSKGKFKEDDASVELHTVTDIDPVQSLNSNKVNMAAGGDSAYDEDEETPAGMRGPGGVQCQQQ